MISRETPVGTMAVVISRENDDFGKIVRIIRPFDGMGFRCAIPGSSRPRGFLPMSLKLADVEPFQFI